MALLTTPSRAFAVALVYITVGALMEIWTIVAWVVFPPESAWGKFWLAGFLVTGLALLAIGSFLGQIGRSVRKAELPPPEVMGKLAQADHQAASNPPPVIATPPQATTPVPAAPLPPPPRTTAPAQRQL